jgi:hypothetical protein
MKGQHLTEFKQTKNQSTQILAEKLGGSKSTSLFSSFHIIKMQKMNLKQICSVLLEMSWHVQCENTIFA